MRGGTLVIPLSEVTNDSATLIALAMRLVEQLYEPEVPYKKAGITLGAFVPEGYAEQSLFASETKQEGLLDSVIDRLNARYGHESILLGRHSQSEKWQSRQEKLSPAYTTDWSRLATVRA
jgi:DNA polymerase V